MHILIRADATALMGTGHVMRCLALAQANQDAGGKTTFVSHLDLPLPLKSRLAEEGFECSLISAEPGSQADASLTLNLAKEIRADWFVLDGYHFSSPYRNHLRSRAIPILLIDDNQEQDGAFADLILNQNIHASQLIYSDSIPQSQKLLGPKYALIRKEFLKLVSFPTYNSDVLPKILLMFGGSDPQNLTQIFLQLLLKLDTLVQVNVVLGAGYAHIWPEHLFAGIQKERLVLHQNVNNIASLMQSVQFAVTAAGSTCYELAYLGIPAVVVVVAENQVNLANGMSQAGIVKNLGWFEPDLLDIYKRNINEILTDGDCLRSFSESGRKCVDGQGAKRVIEIMETYK
ncbi:MAG: UDP-2,4-diacetamido-2,4,6-trideoxy-beta-L-altropyranose hydrolase [Candidatus Sericytochromatia bacterium]